MALGAAVASSDRCSIALDHVGFVLRTPAIARPAALEDRYGELLERVREHLRRAPAAGLEATEQALRDDPLVGSWCERSEVLGLSVRALSGGEARYLYSTGVPHCIIDSSWFQLPESPLRHGRKWCGWMEYELVEYTPELAVGDWDVRIDLTLDLLQLRGLQGFAHTRYGGTTRDPVP